MRTLSFFLKLICIILIKLNPASSMTREDAQNRCEIGLEDFRLSDISKLSTEDRKTINRILVLIENHKTAIVAARTSGEYLSALKHCMQGVRAARWFAASALKKDVDLVGGKRPPQKITQPKLLETKAETKKPHSNQSLKTVQKQKKANSTQKAKTTKKPSLKRITAKNTKKPNASLKKIKRLKKHPLDKSKKKKKRALKKVVRQKKIKPKKAKR